MLISTATLWFERKARSPFGSLYSTQAKNVV